MSDFVTLDEAKRFIRIGASGANDHVQQALDMSESLVATVCSTSFATLADSISWHDGSEFFLLPPITPLQSVAEVYDAWDDEILVEGDDYFISDEKIYRLDGLARYTYRWPSGTQRFRLTATTGYSGATGDFPAPEGLRAPILMMARRLYESGGSSSSVSTDDVMDFLTPYLRRIV